MSVDRHKFSELIGYPPAEHADHADDFDYTVVDTVIPHPAYARQAWVSILNPGPATSDQARALITQARDRASARHKPRR